MCSTSTGAATACTPSRAIFSLSRPLVLLLVVGRLSWFVFSFVFTGSGRFMVGVLARVVPAVLCVRVRVCVPVRVCAWVCVFISWDSVLVSAFGFKLLLASRLLLPACLLIMAEVPAVRRRRGARAGGEGGEEAEHGRRVRARVDDAETRLDTMEAQLLRHETRLQFTEAPLRVVLRGFSCVTEFFRVLRSHDLRAAKTSFIPTFIDELKEKCGPEVTHLIEEAENLFIDRQGWVLIGVFPTGGNFNEVPDGLMRLQPGYAGVRMSHVLVQASKYLADSHQLFQDRVRRPQRGEKGGDKGKGKGKPFVGKGKGGKGKAKGALPKRAAAPPGGAAE